MAEQTVETKETTTVSNTTPQMVKTEHPQKTFEKKKAIFHTYQIIWYVLAIVEVLLGFRMVLKVLGANPLSAFTNLIYTVTNPLALPFSGILQTTVSGASVFEWSTIIAAIVYAVLAYGIIYLIQLAKPVTPDEVSQHVDNQ